jgi:NAD(P)H-dependent FMN reductase
VGFDHHGGANSSAERDSGAMARLLIVHHTPSPAVHAMLDAARSGATDPAIGPIEVVVRAALHATASDVLEADGYLLGTPANLGSMSGALKHFFDTVYYPCLEDTPGRPYGLFVHGNDDTTGAVRDIERIVTGLRWTRAQPVLSVTGPPTKADLEAAWELGAATAALLAEGLA